MPLTGKPRILIFIVAYEAETTVARVLRRIPPELAGKYDVECLVIDDSSADRTFQSSRAVTDLPFPLTVLYNPRNQGYGGNQKIGYHYAILKSFDAVALLHGDGQYAPERLPELLAPVAEGRADAVFGSRMLSRFGALRGGMPLYKFVGNRILTWLENRLLRAHLSEFHSGYRVYSAAALSRIPFDLNSDGFDFDTEIIIQLLNSGARIGEVPIPTYYGNEICRVAGLKYAKNVLRAAAKARIQQMGVFYERKFDCSPRAASGAGYELKLGYASSHTAAIDAVTPGCAVLDLGCARGELAAVLRARKGCRVTGVDAYPLEQPGNVDEFILRDLNQGLPPLELSRFDYVLLLDVLEHLSSPERFIDELRRATALAPQVRILASTGNVGFFIVRLMLLLGGFHYGKRGILDLTHTRLFTFAALRRLFEQGGFRVVEERGIPGPFPLALGDTRWSRLLVKLNRLGIRLSKGLFSYQAFMAVEPRPSLELLLAHAQEASESRVRAGF